MGIKEISWIISGVLLIYISTFISWTILQFDIPITGQSLFVLVVAFLWPEKLGLIAVAGYVFLGGLGLPIFAEGSAGIGTIRGNSGGYIYGFILAAWAMGQFQIQSASISFTRAIYIMIIGTLIILGLGYMHLSLIIGYDKAFIYGVQPFLIGAIIKIIIGALVVWKIDKF